MEIILHIEFDFDGIEEATDREILEYLSATLKSGSEVTNSEINIQHVADPYSGTL